MGFGGAVFEGNSKLFEGPLGVVKVGFKGYDLGKTTADTTLVPDQDVKDITYQQDGTKAADHVRTGMEYLLNATFGEIATGLLALLMAGVSTKNLSALADSGVLDRSIYQSMRDTEAGVLRIAAVNENGVPSDSIQDIMNFYEAIPVVNGDLVNWGADTQRNFPVQFRLKWHQFVPGEVVDKVGAFGYWGDPTTEQVPAAVWPDVEAPEIATAQVTAAVTLVVTFDENIAFQTAFAVGHYRAKVNEVMVAPSAGVIALKALTLTFPAATFADGDIVELYVTGLAVKDTQVPANNFAGVDAYPVENLLTT